MIIIRSFFFKTYEYNDKVLIEKYINHKNKCIIIGGGIGFIPTLSYQKSLNKILVFEINEKIIKNLKNNLTQNNCDFILCAYSIWFSAYPSNALFVHLKPNYTLEHGLRKL